MSQKNRIRKIKHLRQVSQSLRDGTTAPDYGSLIASLVMKCASLGGSLNAGGILDYVRRVYKVERKRLPTRAYLAQLLELAITAMYALGKGYIRVNYDKTQDGDIIYHIQPMPIWWTVSAA